MDLRALVKYQQVKSNWKTNIAVLVCNHLVYWEPRALIFIDVFAY